MLPRCASSHATTADRLPRPVRDLPRRLHCKRVEMRHDVCVDEHADHPQVRGLHLDAVCCSHFTDPPKHPHAAGGCSSSASSTCSLDREQLGTVMSLVAAQRAIALDLVNAVVAHACMLSLQMLVMGQKCRSTPNLKLLIGAPGAGEHIYCMWDLRERRSWVTMVPCRRAVPCADTASRALLVPRVLAHFTTRTHAEAHM